MSGNESRSLKIIGIKEFSVGPPNGSCVEIIRKPYQSELDVTEFSSFSTYLNHSIWTTKDGKAYGIGNNSQRAITGSLPLKMLDKPTEIQIKDNRGKNCKIISAVCSENDSLYLVSTSDGIKRLAYVYHFKNKGYPVFLNTKSKDPVAIYGGYSNFASIDSNGAITLINYAYFKQPNTILDALYLPGHEKAVKVVCCNAFYAALSEKGKVSILITDRMHSFEEATELKGQEIINISGTCMCCFAISKDGKVFAMGNNKEGELGFGPEVKFLRYFTEVVSLKDYKIIAVYSGCNHSLFETDDGRILACGLNEFGELLIDGFRKRTNYYSPVETSIKSSVYFAIAGHGLNALFTSPNVPPNMPNRNLALKIAPRKRLPTQSEKIKIDENVIKTPEANSPNKSPNDGSKNKTPETNSPNKSPNDESKNKTPETNSPNKSPNDESKNKTPEINSPNKSPNDESKNKTPETNSPNKSPNDESKNKTPGANSPNKSPNDESKNKTPEVNSPNKSPNDENKMKILDSSAISKLKIIRQIGQGASSIVYKVEGDKIYALKVLNNALIKKEAMNEQDSESDDDDVELDIDYEKVKKFYLEYEVIVQLKHPNIIKAYGLFFGDKKNAPAILLQYCKHSLEDYIKKMNNDERANAIVDLCNAMRFVHRAGIIHRDLKPSNILIDENKKIKLSDFGICALITNEYETITRTRMTGSMLFMAPELLQGKTDYDEKVDVYAFGVVLYFILTSGQYPTFSIPDIINGKSFPLPNSFSKIRKEILNLCFSPFSDKRPSFEVLYEMIKENISALIQG